MITVQEYKGKNVAVLGLGRSGIATIKSLEKVGANIFAWDDNVKLLPSSQIEKNSI